MKISFYAMGKSHSSYVKEGIEDFTNRINKYFPVTWTGIPSPKNTNNLSPVELKKREADDILKKTGREDYLILLDERGEQMTSEGLATRLQTLANSSTKHIIFLIGGAFGVDETIFARSNMQWSLSKLVFPHQLVRLMLSEQVYRACTIMNNEKYHHS